MVLFRNLQNTFCDILVEEQYKSMIGEPSLDTVKFNTTPST